MPQWSHVALAPAHEHGPLHGGNDKFGDFTAFEFWRQFPGLHSGLQAMSHRFSNLTKNLGKTEAHVLAVLVQFSGDIAVEAAVFRSDDLEETRMGVDLFFQSLERRK